MLASVYIAISAFLISFNKYLMHPSRFPHAMALTSLHMLFSWICLFVLYCFRPSLFPSMVHSKVGPKILGVAADFGRGFVPLGLFFAIGLFASNYAYLYCSVAFLQFMKESNVVLVFCLSAAVGLQSFTRARAIAIAWIISGASMAVTGEIHFSMFGFVVQALSQLGECSKNVLGEWMMTSSSLRLDPLTYTMSMAPMALVPLLIGTSVTFNHGLLNDLYTCRYLLVANAMTAVLLNVLISYFIKSCSSMSFILTGICKDMFIVTASAAVFGDHISSQQLLGFVVCLSGIAAWSSIKLRPEWWEFLKTPERKALLSEATTEQVKV